MEAEREREMERSAEVQLVLRNPTRPDAEFPFSARLGWDVLRLKQAIAACYEGNPAPREQKLIFSGRVLRDTAALEDVLGGAGAAEAGPQTFHLVIKPGGASQPASPALSPVASAPQQLAHQQARQHPQPQQQQQQRFEEHAQPGATPAPSPPTSFSPAGAGVAPPGGSPAPAPAAIGGFDPALLAAYPSGLAAAQGAIPGWTPAAAAGAAGVPPPELPRGYMPVPVFFPMPVVTPQMVQAAGLPMMPEAFNNNVPWAFVPQPGLGGGAAAAMPRMGGAGAAAAIGTAGEAQPGAVAWQQQQQQQQQDGRGGAVIGVRGGAREAAGAGAAANAAAEPAAGGVAAAAPAAANQVNVRVIRIDVRLIIKLLLIVMVMTQDASDRKFYGLMVAALVVYLHQTGLLNPLLRWLRPRRRAQDNANANSGRRRGIAGGLRAIANAEELAQQSAFSTFMEEAEVFVVGFVTSLLPGFHDDPDVAAAARLALNDNEPAPMIG